MRHDLTSVNAGISLFLNMGAKPDNTGNTDEGFQSTLRTETEKLSKTTRTEADARQRVSARRSEPGRAPAAERDRAAPDHGQITEQGAEDSPAPQARPVAAANDRAPSEPVREPAASTPDATQDGGAIVADTGVFPLLQKPSDSAPVSLLGETGRAAGSDAVSLIASFSAQGTVVSPEGAQQKAGPLVAGANTSLIAEGSKVVVPALAAQATQDGKLPPLVTTGNDSDAGFSVTVNADELLVRGAKVKSPAPLTLIKPGEPAGLQSALNPAGLLQGMVNSERMLQQRFSALGAGGDQVANVAALKTVAADGASGLSGAATGAAQAQMSAHAGKASLTVPFHQPNWGQGVGEKVVWMVSQKLRFAEIQLDPPELGPLQVKVSVVNDQVSVSFTSQHAPVRDALDSQAIRLREILESQGLNLVDVDVSDQQQPDQREQGGLAGQGVADVEQGEAEMDAAPVAVSYVSPNLVDYFV